MLFSTLRPRHQRGQFEGRKNGCLFCLFLITILESSVHGGLVLCFWDHGDQRLWRMSLCISQRQEAESEKGPGTRSNLQMHVPSDTTSPRVFPKEDPQMGPGIQHVSLWGHISYSNYSKVGEMGRRGKKKRRNSLSGRRPTSFTRNPSHYHDINPFSPPSQASHFSLGLASHTD